MDVIEKIKQQLANQPVLLYMKGSPTLPQCGFSARAVQHLSACGEKFSYVDILQDSELREALKQYSNWPTYPQLYIKGQLIGGADIIEELYQNGELIKLVKDAVSSPSI